VLILAFDTATDVATAALVRDGKPLGERVTWPRALLVALDELLAEASVEPGDLDGLAVGLGPGSFTGTRIGLAVARGLALATGVPAAGVSTLDALAAGGGYPVVDARRREVFIPGPRAVAPADLELPPGTLCVGDGAVRYRELLEARGAEVPPDDDERHLPLARRHAALARDFGDAERLEPIYVRPPDAVPRVG
jgi:tRNA threonylcarbamoyladenosine biosynthesis protein TsaB